MEKTNKIGDMQKRALAKLIEERTEEVRADTYYGYGRVYEEEKANRKNFLQVALDNVAKKVKFADVIKRKIEAGQVEKKLQAKIKARRELNDNQMSALNEKHNEEEQELRAKFDKDKEVILKPATDKHNAISKELETNDLRLDYSGYHDNDYNVPAEDWEVKLSENGERDLISNHNARIGKLRIETLSKLWSTQTQETANKVMEAFIANIEA